MHGRLTKGFVWGVEPSLRLTSSRLDCRRNQEDPGQCSCLISLPATKSFSVYKGFINFRIDGIKGYKVCLTGFPHSLSFDMFCHVSQTGILSTSICRSNCFQKCSPNS